MLCARGPLFIHLVSMLWSLTRFHLRVSFGFTHVALSVEGDTSAPGASLEPHVTIWHFNQLSYVRHLLFISARRVLSSRSDRDEGGISTS